MSDPSGVCRDCGHPWVWHAKHRCLNPWTWPVKNGCMTFPGGICPCERNPSGSGDGSTP